MYGYYAGDNERNDYEVIEQIDNTNIDIREKDKRLSRRPAIRAISVLSSTAARPAVIPTMRASRMTKVLSGMCRSRHISRRIHQLARSGEFSLAEDLDLLVVMGVAAITFHVL